MRTTLTLDGDVAARLQDEVRRTGQSFKVVVNDMIRAGLARRKAARKLPPFKLETHSGKLNPEFSFECTSALLEALEGPEHR